MNPTLAMILNALLDAAETAYPKFKFLLEYLRPFIKTNMPDGDGGNSPVVFGATGQVGAAPDSVKQIVVDFLTSLMDKTSRPLVKIALRAFISFVPTGIDMIWDQLFKGVPKPKTMAAVAFSLDDAVVEADKIEGGEDPNEKPTAKAPKVVEPDPVLPPFPDQASSGTLSEKQNTPPEAGPVSTEGTLS